jgi:hypothetical protein
MDDYVQGCNAGDVEQVMGLFARAATLENRT